MSSVFLTKSNTNRAVQPHKIARDFVSSGIILSMYLVCSENNGADQLCGYRTADLRPLCLHMQKAGFLICS